MLTPACPRESPEGAARGPGRLGPFTASTAPRAIAQLQPGAACSPSAASPIADFPSGQGVGEGDARGVSVRRSRLAKNSPILTESPGIIHDRGETHSWDRRRFACAPQNQKPRTAAGARTTVAAPSPRVSVVSPSTQIQRKWVHAVSAHSSNGRPAWPTRIRGEISVPELSWLLRVLEHIQKTQIEVGPTNKDFYMYMCRAHKFKPTEAWRRAAQSTGFGARTCDVAYACVLWAKCGWFGSLVT